MKIAMIERYAKGTAPFLGIPVFSTVEGKFVTAVFRREHLQAAMSAPVSKARYDEHNHVLVLNGTSKASYSLKDLRVHTNSGTLPWQIRDRQSSWAVGKRKSVKTRRLDPVAKKILKLESTVKKLERARDKIHARPPFSPLQLTEWNKTPASDSARRQERDWRAEKPMRRKLGGLVRQPRGTWAKFYEDVAEIIGRPVAESTRHDRVCNRRGGPDRMDYLTYLYKHIYMASKPYERSSTYDPYRVYEYAGSDNGLNRFQSHRRAQIEYLALMRERAAFVSQIAGLKLQIEEIK